MLAYAAHRRSRRHLSPPVLIGIVAVHAAAITALALAKMDVVKFTDVVTTVYPVDPLPDPPKVDPQKQPKPAKPTTSTVLPQKPIIDTPIQPPVTFDPGPSIPDPGPTIGPAQDPTPQPLPPPPLPTPIVKPTAPTLLTSGDQLRPPYPEAKRRLEEEATLRLRLAIDPRGRVTAVDPVGGADPLFLDSARAHLLRYWRYRPATEAGQPIATSIVVTLRFRLDGE